MSAAYEVSDEETQADALGVLESVLSTDQKRELLARLTHVISFQKFSYHQKDGDEEDDEQDNWIEDVEDEEDDDGEIDAELDRILSVRHYSAPEYLQSQARAMAWELAAAHIRNEEDYWPALLAAFPTRCATSDDL